MDGGESARSRDAADAAQQSRYAFTEAVCRRDCLHSRVELLRCGLEAVPGTRQRSVVRQEDRRTDGEDADQRVDGHLRRQIAALAAATIAFALTPTPLPAATVASNDATIVQHSIADIRACENEIVRIEGSFITGHRPYLAAAKRARNALIGRRDSDYIRAVGDPGDGTGAIGYLDQLLDRNGSSAWTPAVDGAKVNLLAAAQSLSDALHEKEMEDYQSDLTQALADISLALGRPSDRDVLGGLQGALASTTLGIPAGSQIVPGCQPPASVPAYGVADGHLVYVAVAPDSAATAIPIAVPVHRAAVSATALILYVQDASATAKLCPVTASH